MTERRAVRLVPYDEALLAAATEAWGAAVAAAASGAGKVDPLRIASSLRAGWPGAQPAAVAAALTQARLRHRALVRVGPRALRLHWTEAGLEQATRPEVADLRAQRLVDSGVTHVVDLGAGVGLDTLAFAAAGLSVDAVEADPATAEVLERNVSACGYDDRVRVLCEDVTRPDADWRRVLSRGTALYLDPARRSGGDRRPDPEQWSPSWSWVAQLAAGHPRTVAKVAPGIAHDLPPAGCRTVWTSADGALVEAAVWWPGLAPRDGRAAVVLRAGQVTELDDTAPATDEVGAVGAWLLEPDDAVLRAGLVGAVAARVSGRLIDPHLAYVTTDSAPATAWPLARSWPVLEVLSFSVTAVRSRLAALGISRLVVKKRAFAAEPAELVRALGTAGGDATSPVLFVTRIGQRPVAVLCGPEAVHSLRADPGSVGGNG